MRSTLFCLTLALLLALPIMADSMISLNVTTQISPTVALHCARQISSTAETSSTWCSDAYTNPNTHFKYYLTVGGLSGPSFLAFDDAVPGSLVAAQQSSEWMDTVTFHNRPTGASGTLDLTFAYVSGTFLTASLGGDSADMTLSGSGTVTYAFPFTFGVATPLAYTFQDTLADNGHLQLESFNVYDQNGVFLHSSPFSSSGVDYAAPEPGSLSMIVLGALGLSVLWSVRKLRCSLRKA